MKITVFELNVQGEKWKKKEEEEIWKQIEKLKNALDALAKDIIILTAVCDKQCEIIQDKLKEYEWGVSEIDNTHRYSRYSVLIGVKKPFDHFELIEVTSDKSTDDIDLLKVRFEVMGQFFTVIGCRFTTGKYKLIVNKVSESKEDGYSTVNAYSLKLKDDINVKVKHEVIKNLKIKKGVDIYCEELIEIKNDEWVAPFGFITKEQAMRKQYDSERAAFDSTLLPFISESIEGNKNDVFVLAGDWNHGLCRGALDSVGDYTYEEGGVTKEHPQINFNLQLIKDRLKQYDFEMADIRKDENGRKQPIPTHKIFPIDHIFVRGLTVNEDNVCGTITVGDLSDHAIIWADFDMKE